MRDHLFSGTDEQLISALSHMSERRPITKAEKGITAEAASRIADKNGALNAADEVATDLMIAADNIAHAAKTDPRWEGVAEKLRARLAAYREATK